MCAERCLISTTRSSFNASSRPFELGVMERVIRHLLDLSVPFADRQSHSDIIQTVRTDISQMRMVIQSAANIFLDVCFLTS
jgi:ABC-type bacteriocin/lantibiotic exporter with double-glycine peptidase domain